LGLGVMRARIAVLSLMIGIALVAPSSAQNAFDNAVMPSDEYVSLFTSFCLQKFPDDSTLSAEAGAKGPALTPPQLNAFLHGDPGQGWTISGANTKYILTDEAPPYHACALRHPSAQPLNGNPFFAAAKAFVAASGASLGGGRTKTVPGANGRSTLEVELFVLDAKGQPTSEAYIFIDDSYPAMTRPDGSQTTPFHDVRFVRQIQRQAP
jgi:hypothetical protein